MRATNYPIDATHNPTLRSWVESANVAGCDFPIQNLPFGSFGNFGSFRSSDKEALRIGVAIGDQVLDLKAVSLTSTGNMNKLMTTGSADRQALRAAISAGLSEGISQQNEWQAALLAQSAVEMAVPRRIGDYTDFYTAYTMPPAAVSCFALTSRCCRTINGYRLATMDALRQLVSAARLFAARWVRPKAQVGPSPACAPVTGWTTSWNLAFL